MEGETEGEECVEKEEVKDGSESVAVETSCQSMQELRLDEHEVLKEEQPVDDKEGEDTDGEEHDSKSPQGEMSLTFCHIYFL